MDFVLNTPVGGWESEPLPPLINRSRLSSEALHSPAQTNGPNFARTSAASTESASGLPNLQPMSMSRESLGDRFEFILECTEATGFENFDTLVTAYYRETFHESSPLANEQRLSRNRRLPKVIADVFDATSAWSSWERRGFHEEILKTTESMLIAEKMSARDALNASIAPLLEAHHNSNTTPSAPSIVAMKKMIQNEARCFLLRQRNAAR
jgi:hypothetical protein